MLESSREIRDRRLRLRRARAARSDVGQLTRWALPRQALGLVRLPGVRVEMSGDAVCRGLFDAFTRRHARWRLIQNKRWGVAMLRVPVEFDPWLTDPARAHLRKQLKHARKAQFSFTFVDPIAKLDEILEINRSAGERQGQPMHPDYLDETAVRRYFAEGRDVVGVTGRDGELRAYLSVRFCGELAVVERVLGHADALRDGVVWVLMSEAVRWLVDRRGASGQPTWFMYDMFSGSTTGMRQFKTWLGFAPYRVRWVWRA